MDISTEAQDAGSTAASAMSSMLDIEGEEVDLLARFLANVYQAALSSEQDKARLDFLQALTDKKLHSGNAILSMAPNRGWRLEESAKSTAVPDVRTAIDNFIAAQPKIHIVEGGLN